MIIVVDEKEEREKQLSHFWVTHELALENYNHAYSYLPDSLLFK